MRTVEFVAHLEALPSGSEPAFTWWGEAPEVPTFSASADHLPDLIDQAREALTEIFEGEVRLRVTVADIPQETSRGDERVPSSIGVSRGYEGRQQFAQALLESA